MLLALKMEGGCHEPRNVMPTKSWERQGNGFSERNATLLTS